MTGVSNLQGSGPTCLCLPRARFEYHQAWLFHLDLGGLKRGPGLASALLTELSPQTPKDALAKLEMGGGGGGKDISYCNSLYILL